MEQQLLSRRSSVLSSSVGERETIGAPWPPLISSSQASKILSLSLSIVIIVLRNRLEQRRFSIRLLKLASAVAGLAVVIMGVSGCGKSTVAAMLAAALGCSFVEADDYHSHANKAKMSMGVPLTDADRAPWLESLRGAIRDRLDRGEDVAVSCSALRHKYREILREGDRGYRPGSYATCRVKFVCLEASAEVIAERVQRRAKEGGHFMPTSLVKSQLDLLQIDEAEGITVVDATVRPDTIVKGTIAQFTDQLASTVR